MKKQKTKIKNKGEGSSIGAEALKDEKIIELKLSRDEWGNMIVEMEFDNWYPTLDEMLDLADSMDALRDALLRGQGEPTLGEKLNEYRHGKSYDEALEELNRGSE